MFMMSSYAFITLLRICNVASKPIEAFCIASTPSDDMTGGPDMHGVHEITLSTDLTQEVDYL